MADEVLCDGMSKLIAPWERIHEMRKDDGKS